MLAHFAAEDARLLQRHAATFSGPSAARAAPGALGLGGDADMGRSLTV